MKGYQQAASQFWGGKWEQRVGAFFSIPQQFLSRFEATRPTVIFFVQEADGRVCRDATFVAQN